jgi:hypothetical protein
MYVKIATPDMTISNSDAKKNAAVLVLVHDFKNS